MAKYRYSTTSIPGDTDNHNLRPGHTTENTPVSTKFHSGDTALGNEIWEASNYISGSHPQYQGDKWLHVSKLIRKNTSEEDIDCWMAIVHQGKKISVLTEVKPTAHKFDPDDVSPGRNIDPDEA